MLKENGVQKIEVQKLNPHEEVIEENLKKVLASLKVERRLKNPIVVDKDTKVILDGHHRVKAFKILGLREISCRLVDYESGEISVEPGLNGDVTKEEVVRKGLSDELFPPKTSKHKIG